MFCNNCGKKIRPGSSKCSCGAPVEHAEYCGGFWNLTEKKEDSPITAGPPENMSRNQAGEQRYSSKPDMDKRYTDPVDYVRMDDRDDRGKGSSGKGIIVGAIAAVALVVCAGTLIVTNIIKGGDKNTGEKKRQVTAIESTGEENNTNSENTDEEGIVTLAQLKYQKKYLDTLVTQMENVKKKLVILGEDQENTEDLWEKYRDTFEGTSTTDGVETEYSNFVKDLAAYEKASKDDKDQAALEDIGLGDDARSELEVKVKTASIDLKVYEDFSGIQKDDDSQTYILDGEETLSQEKYEKASEIFEEYQELKNKAEADYIEKGKNNFASWSDLKRMEILLADYCIKQIPDPESEKDEFDKYMTDNKTEFDEYYSTAISCRDDLKDDKDGYWAFLAAGQKEKLARIEKEYSTSESSTSEKPEESSSVDDLDESPSTKERNKMNLPGEGEGE